MFHKALLIAASLAVLATPVRAQEAVRRVTLAQALALAAERNLELRLARAAALEGQGASRQARAFPNPVAHVTHETLSGDGRTAGETYVTLSQELEWPWARSARIEAGDRYAGAARARLTADSARIVFEIREAYVETWAAEQRLALVREVTEVFRRAAVSADARYAQGDLSGYDFRRLRLEGARYERLLGGAQLALHHEARTLAALVDPEGAESQLLAAALPATVPPAVSLDSVLAAALSRRPEIAAAVAELEGATAARAAIARERLPAPTVSGGYKTQRDGLDGLFLGASLPLPLFDRRDGDLMARDAAAAGAEARLGLARRHVANDVRRAFERYHLLRTLIGELESEDGASLLATAVASYAEGEMELLGLLDAADALRELGRVTIDLRADLWTGYFDLERAAGGLSPAGQETDR